MELIIIKIFKKSAYCTGHRCCNCKLIFKCRKEFKAIKKDAKIHNKIIDDITRMRAEGLELF